MHIFIGAVAAVFHVAIVEPAFGVVRVSAEIESVPVSGIRVIRFRRENDPLRRRAESRQRAGIIAVAVVSDLQANLGSEPQGRTFLER